MDREEQIKEKEAMVSDLDENAECFIFGFSEEWPTEDFVDELYRLGYRKIVWHKVADGDYPKPNTDIIYIYHTPAMSTFYDIGVYNYIEKRWYGNASSTTSDRVIAWTELFKYEG